jgi:predicted nucleic acid-binding protein
MLIISDTSVISNLALIDRLDVLPKLFKSVVMPEAVFRELGNLKVAKARQEMLSFIQSGLFKVVTLTEEERSLALSFMPKIDEGESEAISLAYNRRADVLLIDEARGRSVAASMNVPIKGLLGILLEEKKAGHLDALRLCIKELEAKANFFMSAELRELILKSAGE